MYATKPASQYRIECLEATSRWDGMGSGQIEIFDRLRDAKEALDPQDGLGYRYFADDRPVRIAKWDGFHWRPIGSMVR